jgi:hypothetical protein
MSRFSAQVAAGEGVSRREMERIKDDVNLFLEVHERLSRPQVAQLRNILVDLVENAAVDEDDDPDVVHATTGERVGSREEHALAELASLLDLFAARRRLLADALTAPQVADVLGISRQAAAGRAESGSLLAVLDRGAYRFPRWQFSARPGRSDCRAAGGSRGARAAAGVQQARVLDEAEQDARRA